MGSDAPARRRPPAFLFAVPGAVLLVTLAIAIALIAQESNQVEERIRGFERVGAPGEAEVVFERAGDYLLYVEGPVTPNSYIDPAEIILLPTEQGSRRTVLERFQSFVTYTDPSGIGGHAEFTFEVPEPGPYHLKVRWSPEDINGVAIGEYVYKDADVPVRQAFTVALIGTLAALALTVAIVMWRRRPPAEVAP